jgi:hypothetical protein
MHTRQGVARPPALTQHSACPDAYEQDALRREARHRELWAVERLTAWQRFILHPASAEVGR